MALTPNVLTLTGGLKHLHAVTAIDFASTAVGALSTAVDITMTGARIGDIVIIQPVLGPVVGVAFKGYVSAADNVKAQMDNFAAANPYDPASADYIIEVLQASGQR